jgi:hypothetical protein
VLARFCAGYSAKKASLWILAAKIISRYGVWG